MSRENVIAMAAKAGLYSGANEFVFAASLERFAALVAAQEREQWQKDAERYRALRDTLHGAVGGGVEVNDEKLVYQEAEPGEAVRVYWYPVTPVGSYECKADTLDEAVDQLIRARKEET